ncbi:MAG: sterol desaturase family protein [Actinomycetota bacterium]
MNQPRRSLDLIDKLTLPAFAVTMLWEHRVLSRRQRRELEDIDAPAPIDDGNPALDPLVPLGYEKKDTVGSLGLLLGSIIVGLALDGTYQKISHRLYARRIANFGRGRSAFFTAFVMWDFLYYWNHRWMHEVRLFWADHVAHHSGRRYNLSTALRQTWSGFLTTWVYWPMPLLGYRYATIAKARQLNLLYQYWIHTEAIDRLPEPIEKIFNTPSHHRVHHGANKQYIDKNYGGIFIIWDRMFKTFEPEIRRVQYGLTKNIRTNNPVKMAYGEFANIVQDLAKTEDVNEKLRYVFGRPGWEPARAA